MVVYADLPGMLKLWLCGGHIAGKQESWRERRGKGVPAAQESSMGDVTERREATVASTSETAAAEAEEPRSNPFTA